MASTLNQTQYNIYQYVYMYVSTARSIDTNFNHIETITTITKCIISLSHFVFTLEIKWFARYI